jgi:hypothetical protein
MNINASSNGNMLSGAIGAILCTPFNSKSRAAYEKAKLLCKDCEQAGYFHRPMPELAIKVTKQSGNKLFLERYAHGFFKRSQDQLGCRDGCRHNPCACARAAHNGCSSVTPCGDSTGSSR